MSEMELVLTEESKRCLHRLEGMAGRAVPILRSVLKRNIAWQLGRATGAFRTQKTPGGSKWPPNDPYLQRFKTEGLGQTPAQAGVVNGDLLGSISSESNDTALEGRVGSPKDYADDYCAGGPYERYFLKDRDGGWWMFLPGTAPGRPFLPMEQYAADHLETTLRRALAKIDQEGKPESDERHWGYGQTGEGGE